MANDSETFRNVYQLREGGFNRKGVDWVLPEESEMGKEGGGSGCFRYVPLLESKMVHHFDHRFGFYPDGHIEDTRALPRPTEAEKQDTNYEVSPRYWVPNEAIQKRLATTDWRHEWLIGWRDITNTTNERTMISAAFPLFGVGHKLPLAFSSIGPHLLAGLLANWASLVLDYVARQKLGGTSLTYFYLKQFPVLPPNFYSSGELDFIVGKVLELSYTSVSMSSFAHDLGYDGPPFAWNDERRALLRAELDAWYARAYGLTRDELRYILDPADVMGPDYPSETFRVLKEKELKLYGEYRTRRLVLEAWDRMGRGELPAPEPYDQRTAAAQQLANIGKDYPADNPLFGAGPLFDHPDGSRS